MKLARLRCGGCFFQPPVVQHWPVLWTSPFPWDWAVQGSIAPDISREGPQWFLTSPGLVLTSSTALRVPSATAVVQRRVLNSRSYEVPWLFVGVGAEDHWGAFGNIILHFTGLLGLLTTVSFQPPAQDSRTLWDRLHKYLCKTTCWTAPRQV